MSSNSVGEIKIFCFLVSSDGDRRSCANLRAIDRVLVGAEGAATNRFLEYVHRMSHPHGSSRHVLHSVAQC